MTVEILRTGSNQYLEVLYSFDNNEKLNLISNTLYSFDSQTKSVVTYENKDYVPKQLYIVKTLHSLSNKNVLHEMVLECEFNNANTPKKLYFCIGLKFTLDEESDIIFPLNDFDFEATVKKCGKSCMYKTKSQNTVFVCSNVLMVKGNPPTINTSSKSSYKEIIDYDNYDVLSSVVTLSDTKSKKIEPITKNVEFKKKLFETPIPNFTEEGFTDQSYMECELLKEDESGDVYEDVAVVPLKTNAYERGLITFSHFLHFFLVFVVGGIVFPNILISLAVLNNNFIGTPGFIKFTGIFSFVAFFLGGLIIMIVGLSSKKVQKNNEYIGTKKKDLSVMAVVGFYFMLLHLSFAYGMYSFKKFEYGKFKDFFNKENLSFVSFFYILEGYKDQSSKNNNVLQQ